MEYTLKELLEVQKKVDAGITRKKGAIYNPKHEANAELVEMQEHLGMLGSWKKQPPVNEKQAFMELVDIFAFCMSWFNEGGYTLNPLHVPMYYSDKDGIDSLMYTIADDDPAGTFEQIGTICKNTFKRPMKDVFYYYMGKQELTKFRQKNGYKTGDYQKVWAGMEDNEHLTIMLENNIDTDLLQDKLAESYKAAVNHA
jgi:hypothetical protein